MAWIPRGKSLPYANASPRRSLSVIAAISDTGFNSYMAVEGSVTWEIFSFFILRVVQSLGSEKEAEETLFIFDNASTHHARATIDALQGMCNYLFLPPYSPELNPIEFAFAKFKKYLRERKFTSDQQLLRGIYEGMTCISAENSRGYF